MLIERIGKGGATRVLIDTSPDMRAQLLDAAVGEIDAVAYTHSHADHMHGIDDLRMIVFNTGRRMDVWADEAASRDLMHRFGYAFETPEGSNYPPICNLHRIAGPFTIEGAGGPVSLTPLPVQHGEIGALGFRIGDLAYLPDVSAIPESTWPLLEGLSTWVLDALRYKPHPSHVHLEPSRPAPDWEPVGCKGPYCTRVQVWPRQIMPPRTQPETFSLLPLSCILDL